MDWQLNLLLLLVLMPFIYCWNPIPNTHRRNLYEPQIQQQKQQQQQQQQPRQYQQQKSAVLPYLDLIVCPLRAQPWSCARQQSARLLDIWDDELHVQWQKLKDEADRQLNSTLERRGYSDSTTLSKEKPSTILKKIEIGSNFMKEYLAETMDGFLGREYGYWQNTKNDFPTNEAEEYDEESANDDEVAGESDNQQSNEHVNEQTEGLKNTNSIVENSNSLNHDSNDSQFEFVELEEDNNKEEDEEGEDEDDEENDDAIDELKKPGGGNKRRKNKKKKGSHNDVASQAANLLVIQPLEQQLVSQHHNNHGATQLSQSFGQKLKPLKQKRRKRRKGGAGQDGATFVIEQQPTTDNFGLGLLEELADLGGGDVGGKRKKKHPMQYGRSNGVTRFKKKKKKKALMKLMLLGTFLKNKIEILLKLLGAHLQIKFFAIALIGLLINIARFWIDVKRGGGPQKVVYVEHAHHQHHYDDHGEDFNEAAGGGYWKRSLQTDSTENTYDSVTDSYQPRQPQHHYGQAHETQQQYDPQYLAYRNQWQRK